MMYLSVLLLLLLGVACGQVLADRRECNPAYERPCKNGYCINVIQWCDAELDCSDWSDETDCGETLDSMTTKSESVEGGTVAESQDRYLETYLKVNTPTTPKNGGALVKAAEYLMTQRNSDYGWGAFTPRAVVAMSFASRVLPDAVQEKELMEKQLNVQLLLGLQDQGKTSLSKLALYINALYATCQDPRNFQGLDLVARLRSHTDKAVNSSSSIPLAFLTLCLAGELTRKDTHSMADLYNRGTERMSSKALIVMSMICYMNANAGNIFDQYVNDFFSLTQGDADVYTTALFMQVSLAARKPIVLQNLLSEQLPDGSFGDVLATYYAIPVLMNSTLLDLKCNTNSTTNTGMTMENLLAKENLDERHVAYSLWISTDDEVNSHQLTVTYDGNKSFFEVMQIAAVKDPLYRFLYDETNNEKQVYSIGGIPNDSESGKSWILHSGTMNEVAVNSVQNLKLETKGVDEIFPENESHFVFWLKRDV